MFTIPNKVQAFGIKSLLNISSLEYRRTLHPSLGSIDILYVLFPLISKQASLDSLLAKCVSRKLASDMFAN